MNCPACGNEMRKFRNPVYSDDSFDCEYENCIVSNMELHLKQWKTLKSSSEKP